MRAFVQITCLVVVTLVAMFAAGFCYLVWEFNHGSGGLTRGRPVNFSTKPLEDFSDFPVYWLGDEYMGHELVSIDIEEPQGTRTWREVRLGYGRCELPIGEGGCVLPVSLLLAPACEALPQVNPGNIEQYGWTYEASVRVFMNISGVRVQQALPDLRVANMMFFPDRRPSPSDGFVDGLGAWCDAWHGVPNGLPVPRGVPSEEQRGHLLDFQFFPLFWLGEEIQGLPLADIRVDGSTPGDTVIRLAYGNCDSPTWALSCGPPPVRLTLRAACLGSLWDYPGGVADQFARGIYVAPTDDYPTLWSGAATVDVDADGMEVNELASQLQLANSDRFRPGPLVNLSGVAPSLERQCAGA